MKTAPYAVGVVILVVLAGAIGLAFKNNGEVTANPSPTATSTEVVEPVNTDLSNLIKVETPVPGQEISSGFELKGEARGNWYFEASFPAKIVDANGRLIAQFVVTAQGDWMTTNFVPFKQTVNFSKPETSTGSLVLMKDNPSGLPENDRELVIPVKFSTTTVEKMNVKAYFLNAAMKDFEDTDCTKVFAVTRSVPKTTSTGKAAIEELLKGPILTESVKGYTTSLNDGVVLNSLVVSNGVATADFNEKLDAGVAGSCRVGAIRAQIERTLKQFSSIKQVVISVNGNSTEVLQP